MRGLSLFAVALWLPLSAGAFALAFISALLLPGVTESVLDFGSLGVGLAGLFASQAWMALAVFGALAFSWIAATRLIALARQQIEYRADLFGGWLASYEGVMEALKDHGAYLWEPVDLFDSYSRTSKRLARLRRAAGK